MELPRHRLSPATFTALAAGAGGQTAVRELARAEFSKHVMLLSGVVSEARKISREEYMLAREAFDLLTEASRHNPDAARQIIRQPSVGIWARRTILACRGIQAMSAARPRGLRAIAVAAAIRCQLTAAIEVTAHGGVVMLPSLGAAQVPGYSEVIHVADGKARVGPVEIPADPHQDAPGWLGLRRVRYGDLDVIIDDLDPFRMPDLSDLAPRSYTGLLESALVQAWRVLEKNHSQASAEIAEVVSVIVPRTAGTVESVSNTTPEAFGSVGMSSPPDPLSGAATLVHEMHHIKLGALLDHIQLIMPDDGRRYYAPWRDDPRPLSGLLQGAYAYLGVSGFWRMQRLTAGSEERCDTEFARWRAATTIVVQTIMDSGQLTRAGMDFVNEMAHTLALWQHEPVSAQAFAQAQYAAQKHRTRWESAHGPIPRMSP